MHNSRRNVNGMTETPPRSRYTCDGYGAGGYSFHGGDEMRTQDVMTADEPAPER